MKRSVIMIVVVPCAVACASAAAVTTNRWLGSARVFSGSVQSEGTPTVRRTRTDIYAHSSPTDSQYVGTTTHNDVSELAVIAGDRTIESAISADGRTIVFVHDARVAPREAKLEPGVYQYTLGQGIKRLNPPSTRQPTARWGWLGTRPRPFPADLLPIGVDTIWAVNATGEMFPLILLGGSALHRAAFEGKADECAALVRSGTPIDGETYWGDTPLDVAIIGRQRATAMRMIELGANPRIGSPALQLAAHFGDLALVESVLAHGADVNGTDRDANTALHVAVFAGLGGVHNNFFREVESPVSVMTRNVMARVIRLLLDRGANPNATNRDGKTPLDLVTMNFKPSVIPVAADSEQGRYDRFMAEIQQILTERTTKR